MYVCITIMFIYKTQDYGYLYTTTMLQLQQINLPVFDITDRDQKKKLFDYYVQYCIDRKTVCEVLSVVKNEIDFYKIKKAEVDYRLSDSVINMCNSFYVVVDNKKSEPFYTMLYTGYKGNGIVFAYNNKNDCFESDCLLLKTWLNFELGVNQNDGIALFEYIENMYVFNNLKKQYLMTRDI